MATINGAKAMNLTNSDTLEVGKFADMVLLDLSRPSMRPIHNIVKNVVYSGSKDIVKMTMIDGNILYFNGEYRLNVNIEDIYNNCQNFIDRIKNS